MPGAKKDKTRGKLWAKGIPLNKKIEDYTVGEDYLLDGKLVQYDCLASIAHAKMLNKIGLISKSEAGKLVDALNEIIKSNKEGKFQISKEEEDSHTAIENYLTLKLGDLGRKIHTGRSRNDQVLTALRLYFKEELADCKRLAAHFIGAVANFSKKYGKIKWPGYTHTRKAMPSAIGLWADAFIDSMKDNLKILNLSLELMDQSPLGTGAGYGVPLELDRACTASLLGFKKIQINPIYAQHSRGKFESTLLHALSQIMFDLNKIACDLILFGMPEFGYFELPEEFCTGSSMMPQKKNPDVLELVRANYHAVTSCEFQVKNIAGNLITGYHRDLQLTKGVAMKGLSVARQSLDIMTLVFERLVVNSKNCKKGLTGEIFATQEAYRLVKRGVPFRKAYQIIARKFLSNH